ncbi:MAG: helical backbone metal receptor [Acidobacteria bacterium]|nr:helical backbone metal receptor [Acidobacteriota bacterium]
MLNRRNRFGIFASCIFATLVATGRPVVPVEAQPFPQRIVSLVASVTEMLFVMGAGPRVVAVSSFDHFPTEVDRLPRVGALIDPDIEKILSLRPDLVITYGSQNDLATKLAKANVPTFTYRHGSLGDITTTLRELGRRLGLASKAERVAAGIEQDLDRIRTRVRSEARPKTLLVIEREPRSLRAINVSGGYGFLHDLLELAGGTNIFGDVKRESLLVSTETILVRAPDVILELHYTDAPSRTLVDQERAAWSLLPAVPAVKHGRVELLFGEELVLPGPRVVLTATAFARALHPALMPR